MKLNVLIRGRKRAGFTSLESFLCVQFDLEEFPPNRGLLSEMRFYARSSNLLLSSFKVELIIMIRRGIYSRCT